MYIYEYIIHNIMTLFTFFSKGAFFGETYLEVFGLHKSMESLAPLLRQPVEMAEAEMAARAQDWRQQWSILGGENGSY